MRYIFMHCVGELDNTALDAVAWSDDVKRSVNKGHRNN